MDLTELLTCTRCPDLAATRTHVVVGDLAGAAGLALLGEAPGADEDASGRPFVGRAGRVLDDCLRRAGIDRATTSVLNTLKCRPPGNRRPAAGELANCRPWALAQLAELRPRLLVSLGTTATAWALGTPVGRLADHRGRVHDVTAVGVPVLPTYHPSGALRHGPGGEPMRLLIADLTAAREFVGTCA